MEQKILLKAIREDVLLLEELIGGANNIAGLTADEVNFALGRARSLVAELEMLSRFVQPDLLSDHAAPPKGKGVAGHSKAVAAKPAQSPIAEPEVMLDLEEQTSVTVKEPEQLRSAEATSGIGLAAQATVVQSAVEPEIKPEPIVEPIVGTHTAMGDEASAEKPIQKKWLGEAIEPKKSVNDLLHHEPADPLFEGKPLATLKSGIGINDRFLFTRELFAGKNEDFQLAIDQLDRCETIQQAVDYLKSNFKWSKSESADKFLQLVKRRFQS